MSLPAKNPPAHREELRRVVGVMDQEMAERPARGVILPRIAADLRRRKGFGERFRRVLAEKLDLARLDADRGVSLLPVMAHFRHPLGIPDRADAAEGLMAIGMDRLVPDDLRPGAGVDDRLGQVAVPGRGSAPSGSCPRPS